MQGLESLNQFKNFVSSLGGLGRFEDTYMVHAAEGETVVPMEVLDRNPLLKKRLFKSMIDMGIEPGQYIVGNELNSKNPVTGQPEFFLKKIVSQIRKALPGDTEQYLGPLVGLATGNPWLGAIAGGVGSGVPGAILGGGSGYFSPGMKSIFGMDIPFASKDAQATGIMELLRGGKTAEGSGYSGLFGKGGDWKFGEGTIGEKFGFGRGKEKSVVDTITKVEGQIAGAEEQLGRSLKKWEKDLIRKQATEAVKSGQISAKDYIVPYLAAILGGGAIIQATTPEEDAGTRLPQYARHHQDYGWAPATIDYSYPTALVAEGGIMDLQGGGHARGPGTGTSDSIPAMLSDGEFVMTAKAVRGAGGGDRREGARKMYEAMDRLEARV